MRILFFIPVLLALLTQPMSSQSEVVTSTDKLVKQTNTLLKENALVKKAADHKSATGAIVNGYYLKNKLRLVTAREQGEFDYVEYLFYVEKDSLVFANERKI